MLFRKLKRVWSNNHMNYIPGFRETFPELNRVSSEELSDRWNSLNIEFYTEERTEVKWWIRLTLPFAITLYILMLLGLPLVFLIYGRWSYKISEKGRILNWFRALRLI